VNRNNYAELGREMVFTTTPEVIIGGGNPEFYKGGGDYRYLAEADYNALVGGLTAYTHVVTRETGVDGGAKLLSAASTISLTQGHKLFGYFGGEGGQFDYHEAGDMPGSPSVTRGSVEDPTLAQIVDVTLDVLNQDEDGFFVMFEQGDIDWSNHANNFENMIGGVWDLEQAVAAAEDFVDTAEGVDWNNTLVVVTSDHSNSYLRLHSWLGAGDLPRQFGADYAWDYPDGEVSYQTTNHTSELVTLWARGQGAELFEQYAGEWYTDTMIVDNTRIYNVMLDAVEDEGVEHVILFVGDGMNIEHEIAGSRYLYDIDMGLTWHDWYRLGNGWAGFVSTWDVDTYEKYEGVGAMAWDPDNFDPTLGYDPAQGGWVPYPLQWTQGEVRMPIVYLPLTHGAPPAGR
jgi:alkaline phosphatase